jgi:intracellular multiplication protein IcmT
MGVVEDTQEEKVNWHWRNSMRPVRFFAMDVRAAIPWALLLVYARPWTILFAIITTIIFTSLEKRGLTFPDAMRALRSWFVGQKRPAWIQFRHRKFIDYG